MEHITQQTLQAVDTEIMRLIDMGDMNKEVLECLYKLADIKKDTLEAASMEEGGSDKGMSARGSYASYGRGNNGGYSYGGSYYDGGSYAARRNGMGQYSRNNERDGIVSKIEQMMDTAQTENEREMIHRILNTI